jgi:hypothetical protein
MLVYLKYILFLKIVILSLFEYITSVNNICQQNFIWNSTSNTCMCSGGQWISNGTCIENCDAFSRKNLVTRECFYCYDSSKPFYNGQCVDKCPSNTVYIQSMGVCWNCRWNNTYLKGNKCVDKCDSSLFPNNDTFTCDNCKNNNTFLYKGMCVNRCPDGWSIWEPLTNVCATCEDMNQYSLKLNKTHYSNICVDKCRNGLGIDSKNSRCINCTEWDMLYEDGVCVNKCSPLSTQKGRTCTSCKSQPKPKFSLLNGTCVSNCSQYPVDNRYNYCIDNNSRYLKLLKPDSECINGEYIMMNSIKFFCRCAENWYGKRCDKSLEQLNYEYIIDILPTMKELTPSKLSLKQNQTVYSKLDSFLKKLSEEPAYLDLFNYTGIASLSAFAQIYYESSSDKVTFDLTDFNYFLTLYDVILSSRYYRIFNMVTQNQFNNPLFTNLVENFRTHTKSFFIQFYAMIGLELSNNTDADPYTGKFYRKELQSFNIYAFNLINTNFNRYANQNFLSQNTFVSFNEKCNFNSSNYAIIIEMNLDFAYFYAGVNYTSPLITFGVLDKSFKYTFQNCKFEIYFPLYDNQYFRSNFAVDRYNKMKSFGIDAYDDKDKAFNTPCYMNKYIDTKAVLTEIRDNFFLFANHYCISLQFSAKSNITCSFKGFNGYKHAICTCNGIDAYTALYYSVNGTKLDPSNSIADIWFCFSLGFNPATIHQNVGLVVIVFIVVFETTNLILHFIKLEHHFCADAHNIKKHDLDFLDYVISIWGEEENNELLKLKKEKDRRKKNAKRRNVGITQDINVKIGNQREVAKNKKSK